MQDRHTGIKDRPQAPYPSTTAYRAATRGRIAMIVTAVIVSLCVMSVARAGHTETLQMWSASGAAAWEEQDLRGTPFTVPADGHQGHGAGGSKGQEREQG